LNEPFHSKLNIWKQIVKENETEKAVEILQFCKFFGVNVSLRLPSQIKRKDLLQKLRKRDLESTLIERDFQTFFKKIEVQLNGTEQH